MNFSGAQQFILIILLILILWTNSVEVITTLNVKRIFFKFETCVYEYFTMNANINNNDISAYPAL